MTFDGLLGLPPYSVPQQEKEALLLAGLNALTEHHYNACAPYREIVDRLWGGQVRARSIGELPYLPVSLFKSHQLRSVPEQDVRVVLTSSGTTGQSVSRIAVDAPTSERQSRALTATLRVALGPRRLPMLLIDTEAVFKDPRLMSARGAGVLGMMRYGRDHVFALGPDLSPDHQAVRAFLDRHGGGPFLIFGFTFMVWQHLFEPFRGAGVDLSNGILVHSGGWKTMVDRAVDNVTFRARFRDAYGLTRIYNFYGMVEQIGSVLLEGEDRLLYPPNVSDVIVRDPETWEVCPVGREGVVQVVSLIPLSYPGHSLLTEDIGVVEAVDPGTGGRLGKGIRIVGRVRKAELRGCSDVLAQRAA